MLSAAIMIAATLKSLIFMKVFIHFYYGCVHIVHVHCIEVQMYVCVCVYTFV